MVTIDEALAECLEALAEGNDLEACLEKYAGYRDELEALMEVARRLEPFSPITDEQSLIPPELRRSFSEAPEGTNRDA